MHTGANVAWEGLTKWGYVAYSEYWKKKIPAPVKCQKNCTCGPDKFVATFDWNSYPYTLTYQEIKDNESINQRINQNYLNRAEQNSSPLINLNHSFYF